MTPPESRTHDIAFMKQDNGELQEDVVEKDAITGEPGEGPAGADRSASDPEVDAESTESFPASDPPSYWSGEDTDEDGGSTGRPKDPSADAGADDIDRRVVGRAPVEDVAERPHPAAPVPGTLPRPTGPGTDEDRD